ncbi:MAG: hypothetical protein ACLSX5_06160, partial [Lachnospiraceae bacterium]
CSRKKEGILPFLHEREETHMRKFYTAEAVTEEHPDKLRDQIADAKFGFKTNKTNLYVRVGS